MPAGINGEGLRVAKQVNGVTTKYLYNGDKLVLELDGSNYQTARNVLGTSLISRTVGGTTLYYMYNGHADVTALVDAGGTIQATYYYDAFGIVKEQTGNFNNNILYAGYMITKEWRYRYLAMNINEFSRIVDETKVKRPIWFGLESDEESTDIEIEQIERCFSAILPQEYKDFIKKYGGGYFAFTNIFSGKKESEWYIVTRNNEVGLLNSYGFIAFSDNEVGDYYGFKIINGKCHPKIYFYDHEDDQIKITEYDNLFDYLNKVGLIPR
jgi:hypothetical protein